MSKPVNPITCGGIQSGRLQFRLAGQTRSTAVAVLLLGGLAVMPGKVLADEFTQDGFSNPWQGFYLGGDFTAIGAGSTIKKGAGQPDFKNDQGVIAPNLHLGYNFASSLHNGKGWMAGAELGLAGTGFNKKKNDAILGDVKLDGSFLATTRLRGGYVFSKLFVYGSAGLAFTDMTMRPTNRKNHSISVGPTLGIGGEYKFTDKWSVRIEAQSYMLPDEKYNFNGTSRTVERGMGSISIGFSKKF